MKNISKSFDGKHALINVDLKIQLGTIHGILGENGAGKSVLMSILSGSVASDYGTIFIDGQQINIKKPIDAHNQGIVTIYQNVNLVSNLSVAENIFLGKMPKKKIFKPLNWKEAYARTTEIFERLNLNVDPKRLVSSLNYTQKRIVEIAKALMNNVKILIVDEAYIGLSDYEQKSFLDMLKKLNKEGLTIIYISHNIDEVLTLCDSFTVLKNGRNVLDFQKGEIPKDDIIRAVVGGVIKKNYPRILNVKKRILLKVDNVSTKYPLRDISFDLYRGEILGIAGLVGSGRTAIARALFGLEKTSGSIYLNETKLNIKSPADAIKAGFGYLPEDLLKEGLNKNLNITGNITMANLKEVSGLMHIDQSKERTISQDFIKKLLIKTPSTKAHISKLSQGNLQKVHFSKWIHANCRILILDEPTNGIDIGTRVDIYNYMNNYVMKGNSIIFISSNLEELMGMTDRIMVINNGRISKILRRDDFSKESIIRYASEDNKDKKGN